MAYMRARRNVNTLFGFVNVTADTGDVNPVNGGQYDNAMKNFLYREIGLQKVIKRNDRAVTALANPGLYVGDRNQEMVTAEGRLRDVFNTEYADALNLGWSQKEATKYALEEVYARRKREFIHIDEKFPTDITDRLVPEKRIVAGSKLARKNMK